MQISPLGDQALRLTIAEVPGEAACARVRQVSLAVREARLHGVVEVVPAFTSVGVFLAADATMAAVRELIEAVLTELPATPPALEGREVEVPVFYGGPHGPDLDAVASRHGMTAAEVIARHTEPRYLVQAIGFAPGFPYLTGLPAELQTPRRATPRVRVPAGSVGIGGGQTGIYPVATPGGWHLIGRTPLALFRPDADPPAVLQAGDWVRFRAIAESEWTEAGREIAGREERSIPAGAGKIEVVRPGMLTTVQDLGRPGWQAQGVAVGGAVDAVAMRVANLLVGNGDGLAGLEWTLRGPVLRFEERALVAITGATVPGLPTGRPFVVQPGEELNLTSSGKGCRGYLAVSGGVEVPAVLGSASTYLAAGWGGVGGRALRAGDRLTVGPVRKSESVGRWTVSRSVQPVLSERVPVRIVRGAQAGQFASAAWRSLVTDSFKIAPQSDRMGLRLGGPTLVRETGEEMVSEPVAEGTIQVPPDGQPIILLADRQSLGGYPKIAHVISADLSRVAQLRPGDEVVFREIELDEAEVLRNARERTLNLMRLGLEGKLR